MADTLRGNDFISKFEGDVFRSCNLCTYNNDGGEYVGGCPYFQGIFGVLNTDENMSQLDGKIPGHYCRKWAFGLSGED